MRSARRESERRRSRAAEAWIAVRGRVVLVVAAVAVACAEFVVGPGTAERLVRAIQLSNTSVTIDDGQTANLVATVLDQNGVVFDTLPAGVAIAWSSSAPDTATVDGHGVVTALQPGSARVSASIASARNGTVSVAAQVTVRPVPATMTAAAGDAQSGQVGLQLPDTLHVRVVDRHGRGVGGIPVDFAVTVGAGSVDVPQVTTDTSGDAKVAWTLGTHAGANHVEARSARLPAALVTFTATGTPGPISAITKAAGDTQTALVGKQLPLPLTARVADRYGNAIGGATVAWDVRSGGGSVTPASTTTDTAGLASARFTLGPTAGSQSARATVGGVISAIFAATAVDAVASPATSIVVVSSTTVASGGTIKLTLKSFDAGGAPVTTGGRTVVFTSTGGGSTGTISATKDNGDGTYTATFTALLAGAATTIGATIDGVAVTTTLPTISVTPGAPSTSTSLVTVSSATVGVGGRATLALRVRDAAGNNLTTGGLAVTFTATGGTSTGTIGAITDNGDGTYTAVFTATAAGTPLTIGATIGGTAVTSTLPTLQVTASLDKHVLHWIGRAGNWSDATQWDVGRVPAAQDTVYIDAPGTYVVTVDVVVSAARLVVGPGAASGVTLAVRNPVTLSDSVHVRQGGIAELHDASVTAPVLVNEGQLSFPTSGTIASPVTSSGTISVSGGVATFSLAAGQLLQNAGTLDVSAGATLAVKGGTLSTTGTISGAGNIDLSAAADALQWHGTVAPQSATGGTATFTVTGAFHSTDSGRPTAVRIRLGGTTAGTQYDQFVVTKDVDLGGGEIDVTLTNGFVPAAGQSFTVMTFASVATRFDLISLPALPAGLAWAQNYSATSLTLVAYQLGAPAALSFVMQPRTSTAGSSVVPAPQVALMDGGGSVATTATDQVTVTVLDSAGKATALTYHVAAVGGVATFPSIVIDRIGNYSLQASSGTLPTTLSNVFAVVAGAPATIVKVSGDGQSGTVGQALAQPVKVRVTDAVSNPVANVSVAFVVTAGGGSVSAGTVTTDTLGLASTSWTLGGTAGPQTLEARVTGLTSQQFTATATAGAAAKLAFAVQPSLANVGQPITPPVQVQVQDAFGNAVASTATIVMALGANPGGATLSGTTSVAAVNGVATFGNLLLDKGGTGFTLVASGPSLTSATSAAFNVNQPATVVLDMGGNAVVGVGASATVTVRLTTPAPAGGLTVTVTSDASGTVAVQAPGTVFIAAGASTGDVVINGIALGSTTLHGTAAGYAAGALPVSATNQIISTPTTLNVPYGLTASLPIQLAAPAPSGGMTVTLTTSDATHVGIVTQTVSVSGGSQSANGTISGIAPGTATVTASAPGWVSHGTTATTTADLAFTQSSVSIDPVFTKSVTVQFQSGGVARAAPAGGIQVTLTPTNAACAVAVSPVTIPAGQVSVTSVVSYGGSATLPCTTHLTASSPSLTSDSTTVYVNTPPALTLGDIGQVGSGLQSTYRSGTLSTAAPTGGLLVHLVSADSSKLLLAPDGQTVGAGSLDVRVPESQTTFSYTAQAREGATGAVVVTATAPQYTSASATATLVTPVYQLGNLGASYTSLDPDAAFWVSVGIGSASGLQSAQPVRAGGPPLVVTFTSSAAGVGQLVTSTASGASVTVSIHAGELSTPTSVAAGGVAFHPVATGSTTVTASIPGLVATTYATQVVNVTTPTITVGVPGQVGSGLQVAYQYFGLSAPAPQGGVIVHLVSADPTRLLLAPNGSSVGAGTLDVIVPQGGTSGSFTVQALENVTGNVTISASATGYASGSAVVAVVTPVYQLSNVAATHTSLDANAPLWVSVGVGTVSGLQSAQAVRHGGTPIKVTFTSSDTGVAQLVTTTVTGGTVTATIDTNQYNSPTNLAAGGAELDLRAAGTTTVSASIPGLTATNFASQVVTVTAPVITVGVGSQVGSGLQVDYRSISLSAPAPQGGVIVHLVSSDPSRLLLAPNATTVGSATLDVPIAQNGTSGSFTVQALENVTGDVTITATAPAYTSGSAVASVVTPVYQLSNLGTSYSTLSDTAAFWVSVGVGSASGLQSAQAVRFGGVALTATLANSAQSVAQLVTAGSVGQSASVTIAPGQYNSATTVAGGGVGFDALAAGSTTVTVTIPGLVATQFATQNVAVTSPLIGMPPSIPLGSGLQVTQGGSFSAVSATKGVTVHLASSDPTRVLLAKDAASAGAATLDIAVVAGNPSFTFTVQALEGVTGSVTVTATAPGYVDGSMTVNVQTPVYQIGNLGSTATVSGGTQPFWVSVGVGSTVGLQQSQAVRFGGTPLTVTLTNSSSAVAELATTAATGQSVTVTIDVGQYNSPSSVAAGGVGFHPLASGTSTVTAAIPGLTATTSATASVTVSP